MQINVYFILIKFNGWLITILLFSSNIFLYSFGILNLIFCFWTLKKFSVNRYLDVTRRRPCLLFFATGTSGTFEDVFNRRDVKMSGPMSELSYQSIRTANQAREAVIFIHCHVLRKDGS